MYFPVNAHKVEYVMLQEEYCSFVNFSVQNGVFGYISESQEPNAHRRKVFWKRDLVNTWKGCK